MGLGAGTSFSATRSFQSPSGSAASSLSLWSSSSSMAAALTLAAVSSASLASLASLARLALRFHMFVGMAAGWVGGRADGE